MRPAIRYTILILIALLFAGGGVAYFAAPTWVEGQIRRTLIEKAAKRGVDLQIHEIYLDPLASLTIDGVELRQANHPQAPPFARIPRLTVQYDVNGLTSPRVYLHKITLQMPEVYAARDASGKFNLQSLIDRLMQPVEDEQKSGGGWRKYFSKHLPDIEVHGGRFAFDDLGVHGSAAVAGVDFRHLRLFETELTLTNTSPVQEVAHIELKASTHLTGIAQPVQLRGDLQWPKREGSLTLQLPPKFSIEVAGYRLQVGAATLKTDGNLSLEHVLVAKAGDSGKFELDVQQIIAHVSATAGPETELPVEIRDKVPSLVKKALRHVTEVTVLEPVIVAQRQALAAAPTDTADDEEEAPEPIALPPLAAETAKKGKDKAKIALGKDGKPLDKNAKVKPAEAADGAIVRENLAQFFGKNTDRLEKQLLRLKPLLAAIPLPLVTVQHGRARFRDEQQGAAKEVSDFNMTFQHKPGQAAVTLALDFHVPGKENAVHSITGRVDTLTGDAELKILLEQLLVSPYAALLPPAISLEPTSALKNVDIAIGYKVAERKLAIEGKGTLAQVHVEVRRISLQKMMNLTVEAHGKLELDLQKQTVQLSDGELTVGKVHFLVGTTIERYRTAPAFDLKLKIPTVACQDTVDSVPVGFAPLLDGLRCEGAMSFEINLGLDTANMNSLKFDFDAALGDVKITSMGKYVRFDIFDAPFTQHARQRDGSMFEFETGPGSANWVPYELVSDNFVKVITTTEDGGFFGHRGFILDSIKSAMVENLKRGRFVRGASTITQQLVKNLFFYEREKTISRKVQEAVVTWQIERSLPKQKMMELYLNIIELGDKVYGIKNAVEYYFNRPPAEMTLLQALWLGSIVPSPISGKYQFEKKTVSESRRGMLCWIADIMAKREKITPEDRVRLGTCNVVFGAGLDGSEVPPDPGLGHEGDPLLDNFDAPVGKDGRKAPSVPQDEQP